MISRYSVLCATINNNKLIHFGSKQHWKTQKYFSLKPICRKDLIADCISSNSWFDIKQICCCIVSRHK